MMKNVIPFEHFLMEGTTSPFSQSVVKDVVFHGTDKHFTEFAPQSGVRTLMGLIEVEVGFTGYYFSSSRDFAETFGDRVLSCHINITKPLPLTWGVSSRDSKDAIERAMATDEDMRYIFEPLIEVRGDKHYLTLLGRGGVDVDIDSDYWPYDSLWMTNDRNEIIGIDWRGLTSETTKRMVERGYDGAIIAETEAPEGAEQSYVVFDRAQIHITGEGT